MARKEKSQELWTRGEALERAGQGAEAMGLFVKSALAEEQDGKALRARFLWEEIARRTGPTGTVLERLAKTSQGAKLLDDAFDYWRAAKVRYESEGRAEDAARAAAHAEQLESKAGPHEIPELARQVLGA